jgi:S1-C subfamily serine protease
MTLIQDLNREMAAIVDQARQSLVQIQNGRRGAGAGTVWHPAGLILTNAHVVARYSGRHYRHDLRVKLADGHTLPATVIARDKNRDLAALSVNGADLPPVELGDSRRLRPGDWVLAVGHPWGVTGAVTAGTVIATGPPPELRWSGGDLLQVSLHLRPGHSGGPIVDDHGRLVGINMMIAGPDVGLAIPVHTVKAFLRENLGSRA